MDDELDLLAVLLEDRVDGRAVSDISFHVAVFGPEAALQEPVLSMAFTRFRMPWRWNGGPAVLQSRAWDEGGNAQPTRAQFVAARGELPSVPSVLGFGNHHFNAVVSWAVDSKGEIKHVYA